MKNKIEVMFFHYKEPILNINAITNYWFLSLTNDGFDLSSSNILIRE